ncbi:MAG: hypothetical protein JJ714_05205 [Acidithiobacillus sp.]|nr:hypothetical protein [Acidithiobacillus sp.]
MITTERTEPRLDSLLAGWDSPVSFELAPLPPFTLEPLALDSDAPASKQQAETRPALANKKMADNGQPLKNRQKTAQAPSR